jgi:hypothetical protein
MKEPRYTITLDNLTINDVLEVNEAIANYGTPSYWPTKKTRARMAKLKESIWDDYMKWIKANRKCAQHAS